MTGDETIYKSIFSYHVSDSSYAQQHPLITFIETMITADHHLVQKTFLGCHFCSVDEPLESLQFIPHLGKRANQTIQQ